MNYTKMPLIIFKFTTSLNLPMFNDSYDCGWLDINKEQPFILKWGNTKNKETAKSLMQDVFDKQGKREVYLYDKKIPYTKKKGSSILTLTVETLNDILANSERWN